MFSHKHNSYNYASKSKDSMDVSSSLKNSIGSQKEKTKLIKKSYTELNNLTPV